ncbi:SDR family oxidoreductase [Streptomyces canus]|uniref:SDR family oxidoreductase n=1 Tax=Streptomyces canus TaxID=58343 RepID=UPI003723D0A1
MRTLQRAGVNVAFGLNGAHVDGIFQDALDAKLRIGGAEAFRERAGLSTPMLREGEPDELADAVLFLASSEAGHITGAALPVDGGATGFTRPPAWTSEYNHHGVALRPADRRHHPGRVHGPRPHCRGALVDR